MAALTLGELKKRDGRIETLVRLFSDGHKFEMNKGTKKFTMTMMIINNDKHIYKKDVKTKANKNSIAKEIAKAKDLDYEGKIGTAKDITEISAGKLKKSGEFGI